MISSWRSPLVMIFISVLVRQPESSRSKILKISMMSEHRFCLLTFSSMQSKNYWKSMVPLPSSSISLSLASTSSSLTLSPSPLNRNFKVRLVMLPVLLRSYILNISLSYSICSTLQLLKRQCDGCYLLSPMLQVERQVDRFFESRISIESKYYTIAETIVSDDFITVYLYQIQIQTAMLHARILILLAIASLASAFLTGCHQFNPLNFNQCLKCNQNFYLSNGACLICPSNNTIPDCQKASQNQVGQLPILSENSSNIPDVNTNSTLLQANSSQNNSRSGNTNQSDVDEVVNDTSVINAQGSSSKGGVLISQFSMILALLPQNCLSFGIKNNKIACTQCHQDFQLTNDNACIKNTTTTTGTQNNTKVIITSNNTTTNNVSQEAGLKDLYTQTQRTITTAPINSTIQPQVQKKQQTSNQTQTPTTNQRQATHQVQDINQKSQNSPQNQSPSQTSQDVIYPSTKPIIDLNCMSPNLNFSLKKPISNQNARCSACFPSFYYNIIQEICMPKNPLCKQCDHLNRCLSCFPGYILIGSQCHINQGQVPLIVGMSNTQSRNSGNGIAQVPSTDPNCQRYNTTTDQCLLCADRFYLNETGVCAQVDPSCKTWQPSSGICQTCYTGYVPSAANPRVCVAVSQNKASQAGDPNNFKAYCVRRRNNVCTECLNRYFLLNGLCFPVSDLCRTYNQGFGFCESCYAGYVLNNGVCEMQIAASVHDPFCLSWSGGRCTNCMLRYFWSQAQGKCQLVSMLCNGYNKQSGHCTGCFVPYTLDIESGTCVFIN